MKRNCSVYLTLLLTMCSAPAAAQTCLGRASLDAAPFQVIGNAAFADGANGFAAGFGGGTERFFAGATLGRTNFTELDESSTDVDGAVGGGTRVAADRVHLCGLGSLGYRAGPRIGALDTNTVSLAFGVSLGVAAVDTPSYSIVPTFGGGLHIQRLTANAGGGDDSETDTFGTLDLGVGVIFNRRVSITPRIGIPLGAGTNDPVFAITLGINFGR